MPITIFTSFARVVFVSVLVALAPSSRPAAQASDPRGDFLNALGQFSLALDGTYGDEGPRAVVRLTRWLRRWRDGTHSFGPRARDGGRHRPAPIQPPPGCTLRSVGSISIGFVWATRSRSSRPHARPTLRVPRCPCSKGLPTRRSLATAPAATKPCRPLTRSTRTIPHDLSAGPSPPRGRASEEAGVELLQQCTDDQRDRSRRGGPTAPFIRLDLVRENRASIRFPPPRTRQASRRSSGATSAGDPTAARIGPP